MNSPSPDSSSAIDLAPILQKALNDLGRNLRDEAVNQLPPTKLLPETGHPLVPALNRVLLDLDATVRQETRAELSKLFGVSED